MALTGSYANLVKWWARADDTDKAEGMLAYQRYHIVMQHLAGEYGFPLPAVCAAFCALSPNSDYKGNLRSTVSVLAGVRDGVPAELIQVATYRHCMFRAYSYVAEGVDFLSTVKGPKIRNFYQNIMDPFDWHSCTIDGHMSAMWQDRNLTMKEAIIRPGEYEEIKEGVSRLAFHQFMLPNQMQAILWFTRKRTLNVVYDGQHKLFGDPTDLWETLAHARDIQPFPQRRAGSSATGYFTEAQQHPGLFDAHS